MLHRPGGCLPHGASRERAHARRAGRVRRFCPGGRHARARRRQDGRHHGLGGARPRARYPAAGPCRRCAFLGHAASLRRDRAAPGQARVGALFLPRRSQGGGMSGSLLHTDGLRRCPWPKDDPLYVDYHDQEWGVPEYDDRALYEKLMLDGFQAGLSWITILRKRENFRRAFDDFDPEAIARYGARKVDALMQDAGIVRNRAKIEGAVLSARAYLEIKDKGAGLSALLWDFL